jgi:hypothetical protein
MLEKTIFQVDIFYVLFYRRRIHYCEFYKIELNGGPHAGFCGKGIIRDSIRLSGKLIKKGCFAVIGKTGYHNIIRYTIIENCFLFFSLLGRQAV